jgi:hypothetical protein
MQAAILQFPRDRDAMPYSEKRFDALVKRVDSIAERIDNIVKGNLSASPTANAEARGSFLRNPWVVNLGCAVLGGLIVAIVMGTLSHMANDSKKDIANEISRQLGGDSIKNQIAAEISRQLTPMNQRLDQMSEDIGKIKDNLHIAKVEPLPEIDKQLKSLESSARPNESEVTAIASSLHVANPNTHGYWPAVARLINVQARVRTGKPLSFQTVRLFPSCTTFRGSIQGLTIDKDGSYNCAISLDNVDISDATISNALVYFSGYVRLSNVKFKNCIFVVSLSEDPPPPAKRLAEEILASNAGQSPIITINAG